MEKSKSVVSLNRSFSSSGPEESVSMTIGFQPIVVTVVSPDSSFIYFFFS